MLFQNLYHPLYSSKYIYEMVFKKKRMNRKMQHLQELETTSILY